MTEENVQTQEAEAPAQTNEGQTQQADNASSHGNEQQQEKVSENTEAKKAEVASEGDEQPRKRESGTQRLKRRMAALEAELAEARSAPKEREAKDPEPQEKDFPDWPAYDKAHRAWEINQAVDKVFDKHDQRARDRQEAETKREVLLDHEERVEDFRRQVSDFDEVVGKMRGVNVNESVMFDIMDSDKSALIVYHLAKNPEKVRELNAMSERERAREIGKLEGSLRMPAARKETQAGKPLTAIKGVAAAAPDPSSMSMDEYIAWRQKGGGASA